MDQQSLRGLRLIVSSPHRGSGYAVAAAAVGFAGFMGAALQKGETRFSRSCLWSETIEVPAPQGDWIGTGARGAEACAYAEHIARFAERTGADIVVPSSDADLFALTANRHLFDRINVKVLGPDFGVLEASCDKLSALQAADEVGFPTLPTQVCRTVADVESALLRFSAPWVLKGRWSIASGNVLLSGDRDEVLAFARGILERYPDCLLQEGLVGGMEQSLHALTDQKGHITTYFALRKVRHLVPSLSTAVIFEEPAIPIETMQRFAAKLGLSGFFVVQTRGDRRDGFRLIEVNARLGANSRILLRIVPDLLPAILENRVRPQTGKTTIALPPPGTRGASPIEDWMSIFSFLSVTQRGLARHGIVKPGLTAYLTSMVRFYASRPVADHHFINILSDSAAVLPYYRHHLRLLKVTKRKEQALRLLPWEDAVR